MVVECSIVELGVPSESKRMELSIFSSEPLLRRDRFQGCI